jgi:thioesterase domain-containing protein
MMTSEELHTKLRKEIPLTKHLGFDFLEASSDRVRMRARLSENINHKGTAFGGSLYALAVLSAYSLVYLGIQRENVDTNNIVIQKGEMEYLEPVTGDFEVICEHSKPEIYRRFFVALARWKKVRETLQVRILCHGVLCARLQGVFVVRL